MGCDWQSSCFAVWSAEVYHPMNCKEIMRKSMLVIPLAVLLISGVVVGQSHAPGREFENQYLKMTILPGWAAEPSADQKLSIIRGKYLLTINPIFTHATSSASSSKSLWGQASRL
jgi:hypothetical protein